MARFAPRTAPGAQRASCYAMKARRRRGNGSTERPAIVGPCDGGRALATRTVRTELIEVECDVCKAVVQLETDFGGGPPGMRAMAAGFGWLHMQWREGTLGDGTPRYVDRDLHLCEFCRAPVLALLEPKPREAVAVRPGDTDGPYEEPMEWNPCARCAHSMSAHMVSGPCVAPECLCTSHEHGLSGWVPTRCQRPGCNHLMRRHLAPGSECTELDCTCARFCDKAPGEALELEPDDVPEGAEARGGGVRVAPHPICDVEGCGQEATIDGPDGGFRCVDCAAAESWDRLQATHGAPAQTCVCGHASTSHTRLTADGLRSDACDDYRMLTIGGVTSTKTCECEAFRLPCQHVNRKSAERLPAGCFVCLDCDSVFRERT